MKKIVMITGATSGIGEGCARKFAQGGYNLILTGRNAEKLQVLSDELKKDGAEVLTLQFDVRDAEAAKNAVCGMPEEWQKVDVLINNAGLALGLEKEYMGNPEDWNTMIDTNIKGLLTMTRLIVPGMVERNEGHVINIGSVAGDAAYAGGNVYCATKSAVKVITDGLRIDVAESAVRVTNIKPGLVETSTNLASIKMKEGFIEVNTSQRSSIEASKHHLKWAVEQALSMACDEVTHGDGYPGWAPNTHSALLEVTKQAYKDLFHAEPQVLAIHAGLECGLFLEKYPYLDMVSIGPQMYGVHSPQERLSIPSTERCYRWLCQVLKTL